MRQEIEKGYGFRHIPTGRVVRLDIRSNNGQANCGEETCELSLNERFPRFEVKHMAEIVPVLSRDESWYNTSRERPGWGKLTPDDLEVVQFMRTLTWDEGAGPSADPIYDFQAVSKAPFPGFAKGTRFSSRRIPASLYRSYFGVEMERDDMNWTDVAIISFDGDQSPEEAVGRYINGGKSRQNSGLILAVADLPDDYAVDERAKALLEKGERLHIAILDVRNEDGPPMVLTPVAENTLAP